MFMLEVRDVSKSFGGLKAVNGLSVAVKRGAIEALIGPNGAGKSTLLNLITKHLAPDSGKVFFDGEEITPLPPYLVSRRGLGRSFQRNSIFRRLTVFQNIQVAMVSHHGKGAGLLAPVRKMFREAVLNLLDKVGLAGQAAVLGANLSHGDQRRLELAIAMATTPKMILLDEPTAGMSIEERTSMVGLLRTMVEKDGMTVLFTEHDMDVVFSVAQRITVMNNGSIFTAGTPDEVRRNDDVQRIYFGEE
jgi:branched-chain amino acid transport system ATP-binding protein